MKTALITTAIAAAALLGFTTEADAGGFGIRISTGGYGASYSSGYGYRGGYCNTRYLVRTCEVNRCRHRKVRYDNCGRAYNYYVTVVTYRAYYSDGTSRTYTKTFA